MQLRIDVCSHHSNTPHRWTWWIEERIAIRLRSPTDHKHDSHIFNFSFWGIYKLSWSWSHGSFGFTTTHAIQGRSYPKMKCTQICLKVWWRVTKWPSPTSQRWPYGSPQKLWGKWCKMLHSCNFLALKMIPRKPNFHEQQVNFWT